MGREALLEFRAGTDAEKLGYLRNWNAKNISFMCSWDHITCNTLSPRRVISVWLDPMIPTYATSYGMIVARGLSGTLSSSLGNLTQLKNLNLANNFFYGGIPEELGKIQSLQYLDLSNNSLTGSVPKSIGNLSMLDTLILGYNELSGSIPTALGSLHRSTYIELSVNSLSGRIPSSLGNCSELRILLLGNNSLVGEIPEILEYLPKLSFLFLTANNLTGMLPRSLTNSTSLYYINLSRNKLQGEVPGGWGNLTSLRILDLGHNALSGAIPPTLGELPKVGNIILGDNNLTGTIPATLGQLQTLAALDLSHNNLTGSVPGTLGNCTVLWLLSLGNNKLQGKLPVELFDLFSDVSVIDLYIEVKFGWILLENNRFIGEIPPSIANCSRLEVLSVRNNNLTGHIRIPEAWYSYPSLRVFDAAENYLQGTVPGHIGNQTALEFFIVGRNQLRGSIPKSLELCRDLSVVDLSENKLTGTLPRFRLELLKLVVFNAKSNKLRGELPVWVWNLTSLKVLDLSQNDFVGHLPSDLSGLRGLREATGPAFQLGSDPPVQNVPSLEIPVRLLDKGSSFSFRYILAQFGSINLAGNKLSGKIPSEVVRLRALHSLNLSHNQLTGQIADGLGSVPTLQALDLSHNNLTGRIPWTLSDLSLGVLNLAYNNLTGPIPSANAFDSKYDCSSFFPGNSGLYFTDRKIRCSSQAANNVTESETSNPDPGAGEAGAKRKDPSNFQKWISFPAFGIGFLVGWCLLIVLLVFSNKLRRTMFFFSRSRPHSHIESKPRESPLVEAVNTLLQQDTGAH
ncbi:hypothetical protein Mapa_001730 [Marchantia paleacea]|nr:hypothetical protein Mapa_001730 [Marchantia paleacea]